MERRYIIPLRRELLKVPKQLKARKAIKTIRAFVQRHMKVDDVKIGRYLNLEIWKKGNRNPPHKIEVVVEDFADKEGRHAKVELVGAPKEEKKVEEKKGVVERLKEAVVPSKEEKKEKEKILEKEEERVMESREAPPKEKKFPKKEVAIEGVRDVTKPRDMKKHREKKTGH